VSVAGRAGHNHHRPAGRCDDLRGDLGARAGYFGSAAIADDFAAVRSELGIEKVDLWGQSWGTYLMPVYAARHPDSVRSIVLSGAQPIAFDPWGRDVLRASSA
jgi:pimeloyl-ACP methyl ester carboxylesterase